MKKLLSIVICFVISIGMLYAGDTFTKKGKTTVVATALNSGGTVLVEIDQPTKYWTVGLTSGWNTSEWKSSDYSQNGTAGVTSTGYGYTLNHIYTAFGREVFNKTRNIQYRVSVQSTNTGYYFAGWTKAEDENSTPFVSTTTYTSDVLDNTTNEQTIKLYAIFKKQTVHKDYAKAIAIFVDSDGKPTYSGTTLQQGGGKVYIGEQSVTPTATESTAGGDTLVYSNEASHTWSYRFNAAPDANYAFVGWYTESKLLEQLQNGLCVDFNNASNTNASWLREVTSTSTDHANPPVMETLYAVFRPSLTYYHKGPSVTIAGDEDERAEKGAVFADDGTSGTVAGVPTASWVTELHDETVYSQVDDIDYSYTYYAKASDESKYAFKGWATTPYGAATYQDNPLTNYTFTMSDENTSEAVAYRTPTLYAVFESFFYRCPPVEVATNSKGSGQVYVSLTSTSSPTWSDGMAAGEELQQVAANSNSHSYTVYYYAQQAAGATFSGWSSTADGLNIVSTSATYSVEYTTQAKSKDAPHVAAPLYAVFKHDFDIRQQDRMIVYIDDEGNGNINDAKVLIDFQKGDELTATLSGTDASCFTLSNRTGSKKGSSITFDATQGLIELVVAYQGDLAVAVGKKAEITLTATYGGATVTRPVTIIVEKAPIITFLPTDGKGTYTVKMTNGSGINYTMDATTKENIKVPITHESMSNLEMNLTSDIASDNYRFFGWQMIDGDATTYLSYDELVNYQFTKSVKVRAEFIHNKYATYSIMGDDNNTPYHDFALAMKDAEALYKTLGVQQTVVLNDYWGETRITEAVLPKGNYTIPTGANLLIPGDAAHTYRETLTVDDGDFPESGSSAEYIKWVIEDGTNITVKGGANVHVFARQISGRPEKYGHIYMKENCNITFESGANFYAYGYITGSMTSSVVMNSGTKVKESFQILDWRGGNATTAIVADALNPWGKHRVFVVGQYTAQNVEVPMTLKAGCEEIVVASIPVSGVTVMEVTFIGGNNGLFRMGSGTTLTKSYNPYTDRVNVVCAKEAGATGQLELGNVAIDVGIAAVDSKDYILPIPNNFTIKLQNNVTLQTLYDFALMPGGVVEIEKGSKMLVENTSGSSNLYCYDANYSTVNGKGYYGTGNYKFRTISHRPGGKLYTRTDDDLVDAKVIIDGELVCSTNGYIYTTNTSNATANHANITSNGGGKLTFATLSSKSEVYQIYQVGTDVNYVDVPVASAHLRNGGGTYAEPVANTTFTYIDNMWTANTSSTQNPNVPADVDYIPRFNVAESQSTSTYVGESSTLTIAPTTNNTNVTWSSVTWAYAIEGNDANQFTFAWGTKPNGTITFTPTSEGTKTATLRITATYTRNVNTSNTAVKYTYTKDVALTGTATYLHANTLAFADLSTLYNGQSNVGLFQAGSKNNNQPISITITPNTNVKAEERGAATASGNTETATITPSKVGSIVIKAEQEADLTNNIAATTITKTIKVNDRVQWNWDILYLGELYDTPITMLDGSTGWTLTETKDEYNIINFQGTAPNYTASVADLIAGSFKVEFTFTQNGQSREFTSNVIVDPRHLRVDVNSDTIFRAVTLSANEEVNFREGQNGGDGQIVFTSTESYISQWKLGFFGVPDKIHFQPNGTNAWQIEESPNGVNWTTSFPWKYIDANIDFELSLLPSTRYLRISYGAGSTTPASLKELYITELTDVKADVEKLYIPVQKDANGSVIPYTKEVVLTYANTAKMYVSTTNPTVFKVKESTSTDAATDVLQIDATSEENPFGIKGIEVVSTADKEMEGYLEIREGTTLKVQIPIQTYLFPQELPIKLATDKPDGGDRYYYVTTHTHNAEWDGRDNVRTITLNNAVSDAAPYVTFEYSGNPTYIGFNYSTTAKGTWELEQYINNNWAFVPHTPDNGDVMDPDAGTFKRFVDPNASKLRVIYQSEYAEKVNITDLVIVGDASAIVDPARMELDYNVPEDLNVTAINLPGLIVTSTNPNFTIAYNNGTLSSYETTHTLSSTQFAILNGSDMGTIPFQVKWQGTNAIEHGTLELTATINDEVKLLATVELIGMKADITDGDLGIYTGVGDGYTLAGKYNADGVTLSGRWQGDTHRPVNIAAAFSPTGAALFDYVVVYGETTTSDGSKTINLPNTLIGSNAKTPCYIYKKNGTKYQFYKSVENANSKEKTWNVVEQEDADAVTIPTGVNEISMYITGFCPYASTGYTKADEGVWYFRGGAGQSINVYLQDCYIYSRAKTHDGHSFADRQDGNSFSSRYTCGSGAVLVFACNDKAASISNPMNVTIHTLDNNLLKSNYGCFLQSAAGRVYHVSPSVQIRLIDDTYYVETTTTLNFTDEWPASMHEKTGEDKRTNGFLSLQKQHNNAPSIDMGNENTVVNFNGGQVELQNAQIVSTNYVTTLAICHRTGTFAGILLAYGLGTDGVGGTVNFNDGTTTVLPMEVAANYRQYYLMDTDAAGNELTTTSCLRTPEKTFVKGGSHCMMRACPDPTSKGGAPKDKDGKLLGLYKYTKTQTTGSKYGWSDSYNDLVQPTAGMVPDYYGVQSVTPNNNGTKDNAADDFLNFWFDPDFEPSAKPEINVPISFWKTCMTEIAAQYGGYGGSVGGEAEIVKQNGKQEEIVNLMYCKIDEYIHNEIRKETFAAPVKNPGQVGEAYLPVKPSRVGDATEHYINSETTFQVEQKIYYITTATADVWNAFTAPFDVENIYIMETYPEQLLKDMEGTVVDGKALNRKDIIQAQAKHNADFAAFFAVTVALGQQKDFETIYREYIDWAKIQDKASGVWDGKGTYTLRGKSALVPFNGSNWQNADFYLNENAGPWLWEDAEKLEDGHFTTTWQFPDASDGILMHQGKTYSMLLPFCTRCGTDINSREFWDYWSGKFLIFESTDGPHIINGSDVLDENNAEGIFATVPSEGQALLKGNSTFAKMETLNNDLFTFSGDLQHSTFYAIEFEQDDLAGDLPKAIAPTESFLMPNIPVNGMRPRGVTTSGEVIYDLDDNNDGTATGGNIPTVGGGNDLFITSTVEGINIAVAEPQYVRVLSSTGAVLYSGMVQTAVDVALPTTGVYVITGENEVHKILH